MEPSTLDRGDLDRNFDFKLDFEIEEDVEAELDEFVLLSHMNRFHDAHQLYNECLAAHQHRFPILTEYGDCLLREGSYKQLLREVSPAKVTDPKEKAVILLMNLIAEHAIGMSSYDYYNKSPEKHSDVEYAIASYEKYSRDLNNMTVIRIIQMAKTLSLLWVDTGINLSSVSHTDPEVSR